MRAIVYVCVYICGKRANDARQFFRRERVGKATTHTQTHTHSRATRLRRSTSIQRLRDVQSAIERSPTQVESGTRCIIFGGVPRVNEKNRRSCVLLLHY